MLEDKAPGTGEQGGERKLTPDSTLMEEQVMQLSTLTEEFAECERYLKLIRERLMKSNDKMLASERLEFSERLRGLRELTSGLKNKLILLMGDVDEKSLINSE